MIHPIISAHDKALNAKDFEILAIEGERNADTITIYVPLNGGGVNNADLQYAIKGVVQDTVIYTPLGKSTEDGRLKLTWTITAEWTTIAGYVRLTLVGTSEDGQVIRKWEHRKPVLIVRDGTARTRQRLMLHNRYWRRCLRQ
jgi:hypothetical protein